MTKEVNTEKFDIVLDKLDDVLDKLGEDREYEVIDLANEDNEEINFLLLCSYAINDDYYVLCEDEEGVYNVFRTVKQEDGEILYYDIDNNVELLEALEAGVEALESLL